MSEKINVEINRDETTSCGYSAWLSQDQISHLMALPHDDRMEYLDGIGYTANRDEIIDVGDATIEFVHQGESVVLSVNTDKEPDFLTIMKGASIVEINGDIQSFSLETDTDGGWSIDTGEWYLEYDLLNKAEYVADTKSWAINIESGESITLRPLRAVSAVY